MRISYKKNYLKPQPKNINLYIYTVKEICWLQWSLLVNKYKSF